MAVKNALRVVGSVLNLSVAHLFTSGKSAIHDGASYAIIHGKNKHVVSCNTEPLPRAAPHKDEWKGE